MFTYSQTVRSGLNRCLRQSHEEHIENRYNAQYILSAEFDNKLGPVLGHQYPSSVPGFRSRSNLKNTSTNLASLMIPNNAEDFPERADFTTFILYRDKYTRNYQLFPIMKSVAQQTNANTLDILKEEESPNDRAHHNDLDGTTEPPLFFINVVNTLRDENNDRGAVIKSIAIGTTLPNFLIFKPLLTMVLNLYMRSNDNIQILIDCFKMINSLDLSLARNIMSNRSLQMMLTSINDERILSQVFDTKTTILPRLLRLNALPETDSYGNRIAFKRHLLEYQFTKYCPRVLPAAFSKISLQMDIINHDPIKVNINYNDHVLKFLSKFTLELKQLPRSQFAWKLLINSTRLSKDTLCQFVISLSNFIKHFDCHYFGNAQVIIFPYMDISFIDKLKEQLSASGNQRTFTIVGVSNPIFECYKDVWDFYYDIDTENLQTQCSKSCPTTMSPNNSQESLKGSKVRKLFQKRTSLLTLTPEQEQKISLTSKMIGYLVQGQHDNETILSVFKRINILQILSLVSNLDSCSQNSTELSLKDEYVVAYRDFTIFPEFFEYGTLKLIRCFDNLEQDLNFLLFDGKDRFEGHQLNALERIFAYLKYFHKCTSSGIANLEKFINIGLNFPLKLTRDGECLSTKDFGSTDLHHLFEDLKGSNSLEGLCSYHNNAVDYFVTKRFLNLIFLPLLLDSRAECSPEFVNDLCVRGSLEEASLGPRRLVHSDRWSSPISSTYNGSSLFQDSNTDDTGSRRSSSKKGSNGQISSSEAGLIVPKIKKICILLIRRLRKHPVGNLVLEQDLNPMFKYVHEILEEELTVKKRSYHEKRISLLNSTRPSQESSMTVSPSRQELLKDLDAISQQQGNIKYNTKSTRGEPARASLLESLNQLTVNYERVND
ncbi:LADA_0B03884g1_1 [Lachancea dasiensis]|uniref:LADA_0B03884g1_1 n=1 Tax=Lachancea dasiensis TaxID=1072105 RepID=A0A1G4ISR2_9SACH|nr:LADA_0B03884g1_1 [Lachancea dasiensis]